MEKKAIGKYMRLSEKKLRMIVSAYRGMNVVQAMEVLPNATQKAATFVLGVLKSAVAQCNTQKKEDLYIKSIQVQQGPLFKRWRPGSRGMAKKYSKKTAHLSIVISDTK